MRKPLLAALALVSLLPAGAMAEPRNIDVVNRSAHPIVALALSPASTGRWGPVQLETPMVAAGATIRVRFPADREQCLADVRVSFAGGETSEVRNVDLCRLRSLTVSDGDGGEDEEDTVLVG